MNKKGKSSRTALKPTRNPLAQPVRELAVDRLNTTVAELLDLFGRIKQAHWNLRGLSFIGLHKLLDEFAASTLKQMDEAAERATALGGLVEGTLRDAVQESGLQSREEPASRSDQRDWIQELAKAHSTCSDHLRRAIEELDEAGDAGTADLLTDILRLIDKQLWLLEAHLGG